MKISEFFRIEWKKRRIPCVASDCGDFLIAIGEHGELVREKTDESCIVTKIKFKDFITSTLEGKPLPFPLPAAIGMDAYGYLIYKPLSE